MKRIAYISAALGLVLLVGCYPRGFRPAASNYEAFIKPGQRVPIEQVKRDLVACGYAPERGYAYRENTPFGNTGNKYSLSENEEVLGQECMFTKGYVLDTYWGGLCSDPDRRSGPEALPNCKNAPIRPRRR